MYGRVFFVALGLVGALGAAAIYGVGAHLVVDGGISTGTLVALAALVTRVYQPLTGLTNARVDLMTSMVSFERVFEVLDAPEAIAGTAGRDRPRRPGRSGRVRRRRVPLPAGERRSPCRRWSSTPDSRSAPTPIVDVLRGLSLTIEPGETVALVGASGAGKTTTDRRSSRGCTTSPAARCASTATTCATSRSTSLRAAIGVVSQDPHLFHESIVREPALRQARRDARASSSRRAQAARIHDTIAALPDGYDTIVGERGYRLSGGEKQRLAIARLLLKDPAIMILDEATSHLDNENEAHVQAALETALAGPHRARDRPPPVDDPQRRPHRVRRATAGSSSSARHDELVAANGRYAHQLNAGELVLPG